MTSAKTVMLELRPALDGHSGIPQEARLLFRGLTGMQGVEAVGLLQSGNLVIERGLPVQADGRIAPVMPADERTDRLSRVVVSLLQGPASHRFEWLRKKLLRWIGPAGAALRSALGGTIALGAFEPERYRDFIWRAMFAKSLPEQDFAAVTGARFRIMRWPWSATHAIGVVTSWLGRAVYPRLDTTAIDVLLAETPFPGRVCRPTKLVIRYHDAIPLLMPHTIKDRGYHRSAHYQALRRNVRDGAWFACVSDATRQDLLGIMPAVAERAVTIPNMVSHHFFAEQSAPQRVPEILWSRKNRSAPHAGGVSVSDADLQDGALSYLLIVGTIEPRKNHLTLLDAWERLRSQGHTHLQLVVVGGAGWDHDPVLRRFEPWLQRGGLHLLSDVPADDLRVLYRHGLTVCPSFGEGFDFPGIEAMRSGGIVAASDLPVHRGVFDDGCAYFNAYSSGDLADCLSGLLLPDGAAGRAELVLRGGLVATRYLPEVILPKWSDFLKNLH